MKCFDNKKRPLSQEERTPVIMNSKRQKRNKRIKDVTLFWGFISCFTLKVVLLPVCVFPPVFCVTCVSSANQLLLDSVFSPPVGRQRSVFPRYSTSFFAYFSSVLGFFAHLLPQRFLVTLVSFSLREGFQVTTQHPLQTSCFSFDLLFLLYWCTLTVFMQRQIINISGCTHFSVLPPNEWVHIILLICQTA